jgi:multiple sugar transport system substrate-binding protein
MSRGAQTAEILKPLLESFQVRNYVRVRLRVMGWDTGWSEITRIALYQHGPDVSEIGSTWTSSLVAMNALRQFTAGETAAIGPDSTFIPPAWGTVLAPNETQPWGIPFLSEAIILHYRKDMLEKAGVDETTAFTSYDALVTAVRKLRSCGIPIPIALPNRSAMEMRLHLAASFIWKNGGEFVSPDGKQVLFHQPEALEGVNQYFRLYREMSTDSINQLEAGGVFSSFHNGSAAITTAGPWLHPIIMDPRPDIEANWGAVRLPGIPFIGGVNLAIWRHTRHEQLAIELVKHLSNPAVCDPYCQQVGMYPARQQAFTGRTFISPPIDQAVNESLAIGRSFPMINLWAKIEERLIGGLAEIHNKILDDPTLEIEKTTAQVLDRIARHLNLTLSQD